MKVSLNIVKSLIGNELPPIDMLVERINSRLGGVEGIVDLGEKYKDAKIVKVVECEKHPDADKLSVCQVDTGEGDLVQVVCGAPNARIGMWAVWLPPKSIVPSTFDDTRPFVLDARELRGVMSHGMLASAKELGLGDDHDGIVEITERDLLEGTRLESGLNFAEVFGLNDTVVEIENKMFTHRPDLFGQLGVAREISSILQGEQQRDEHIDNHFLNPDWYGMRRQFAAGDGLNLEVFNDATNLAPRFTAVAIKDIEVMDSPLWLRCQLIAMGAKPINNIVDLTNYIMLMSSQPAHAYDYDKLSSHKIGVRLAKAGERITLINGKSYELTADDIVIADGEGPIGLAGVMGGIDSEVTGQTKNVVLEVASFDMYTIRRTSMRHGLFTDAVTRFNRGQSSLQQGHIMMRLIDLMPGHQASSVFDLLDPSVDPAADSVHGTVSYSVDFINQRLGTDFTPEQIGNIMRPTNIVTFASDDEAELLSTAPFWRTDVQLPEDIVEEVGRLYGFDRLPRSLPSRSMKPAPRNSTREAKEAVRQSLVGAGANEVLTYSFVHENILKRAEQDSTQAFRLSNALSPDLQYYRLTVLPSLLDRVHANIKSGHGEFILFEIGKGHNKKYHADDDAGLPGESNFVDMVYASKKPQDGAAYYRVRAMLDKLSKDLKSQFVYKPVAEKLDYPVTAPFDQERSALIETVGGVFVGMVGELKQSVVKNFKLPEYTAAATLDLAGLDRLLHQPSQRYRPLSRYPSVSQDVSIKVSSDDSYEDVLERVRQITDQVDHDVNIKPISIYRSDLSATTKTITFQLTFTSHEGTLSDKDISPTVRLIEETSLA